jgi:predicted O-methyltransferase YrrM
MIDKIGKTLQALGLIIKNPYLLNLILDNEEKMKQYVVKQHAMPRGLPVLELDTLFEDFQIAVNPYAYLSGATMPIDIALLKALAQKYNVQKYFEIGTWRGESVANVAQVVPDCTSFNLSQEDIFARTNSKEYAQLLGFFSKQNPNIKHIYGNSLKYDFASLKSSFDMVFIDGDHHYKFVNQDTKTAFSLLKDEKSIIVWHDYALDIEQVRWSVLAGILDGCPKEKRNNIYHISNTLCAVYLPESFPSAALSLYSFPKKHFEISIKMKK